MLFDNYQIIEPLRPKNTLANTQLWLAFNPIAQQNVVIKQLLSDFTTVQYQQFYQETQVYQALKPLKLCQQPYFFNSIHVQLSATENWLVVDYYHGQNLKQGLTNNYLTFNQKIHYLIDICHALNLLHLCGFTHCDIKPSNIFIGHPPVKLFDFGLAQKMDSRRSAFTTAGTPAYMSPEQLTGNILNYQSDYYNLGIVMYECLIGMKPFVANCLESWAIAHCQLPVPRITKFSPEINTLLDQIFTLLLAKFPHNRPQNLVPIISHLKKLAKA